MSLESQMNEFTVTISPQSPRQVPELAACQQVLSRTNKGSKSLFRLSGGLTIESRRYLPLGERDSVFLDNGQMTVFLRKDHGWIDIAAVWEKRVIVNLGGIELPITFKEIETDEELAAFLQLKKFHYRGGGGAGRTVPIIGVVDASDLPKVVGFVELSSSMIANTARKRFFDAPYREKSGLGWNAWDRSASRELSSVICRISRYVIHPELRGLGLASHFTSAARAFASERWHFGGYRARFLEITADMLRYYPFVGSEFIYMGETEGNSHRVSKDMNYLVRRALTDEGVKAMPQGGGGIMSLQRGYATTLLEYLKSTDITLEDAISQLRYDPSMLNQETWEALHRLNRRPKPSYISGLSPDAEEYIRSRSEAKRTPKKAAKPVPLPKVWRLTDVSVHVKSDILQTTDGRVLQDTFGFVGAGLDYPIVENLAFTLREGSVTLICGASGAGKSLLVGAIFSLLEDKAGHISAKTVNEISIEGSISDVARTVVLPELDGRLAALEYLGRNPLHRFLTITARCGLAEPQLFVRPIRTLSSGQRYRLQIALAFLSSPDILVVDNFCESLDRFSARAVCRGLISLAREERVCVVVATAAYDRLEQFLLPDATIMLRRGGTPSIQGLVDEI